jgi:hypothetical protein
MRCTLFSSLLQGDLKNFFDKRSDACIPYLLLKGQKNTGFLLQNYNRLILLVHAVYYPARVDHHWCRRAHTQNNSSAATAVASKPAQPSAKRRQTAAKLRISS